MKRIMVPLMVMALAFMAMPALADYTTPLPGDLNNTVVNGDFQSGYIIYPSGIWNPVATGGHVGFSVGHSANFPYNYWAQSQSNWLYGESSMYQIVDASQSNGWNANGTSENWWFTFQYERPANTGAEYALFYYNGTSATAPAFGGADAPGTGWVPLVPETTPSVASSFTT